MYTHDSYFGLQNYFSNTACMTAVLWIHFFTKVACMRAVHWRTALRHANIGILSKSKELPSRMSILKFYPSPKNCFQACLFWNFFPNYVIFHINDDSRDSCDVLGRVIALTRLPWPPDSPCLVSLLDQIYITVTEHRGWAATDLLTWWARPNILRYQLETKSIWSHFISLILLSEKICWFQFFL